MRWLALGVLARRRCVCVCIYIYIHTHIISTYISTYIHTSYLHIYPHIYTHHICLGAAEAAVRVNAAAMHVVFELMGWIPEGRQEPSLEMLSYRPCAVQVRASQAAITRPGCYNTPRDA